MWLVVFQGCGDPRVSEPYNTFFYWKYFILAQKAEAGDRRKLQAWVTV